MAADTSLVVRKEIVVERSREDAFRVFTTEMTAWWPTASHSINADDVVDVLFEGHVGGRIAEVTSSGDTLEWGRVLEWGDPEGFTVSWKPNLDPAGHRTTWRVRFESIADEITRVEVVHSGFEGFGEEAGVIRAQYVPGWDVVLGGYMTHVHRLAG